MRTNFQEIENFINDRVKKFFDKLNARTLTERQEVFDYEDECAENEEEDDTSTQSLRIKKNQLIDLKQHLERYVNTLPLFGFNSGRCDLNLLKSYLIPYLIRDKEIDPTVLKKASDFILLVYVGVDQGVVADPHVLTKAIEYPVSNLCIKIRNRFPYVLREGLGFLCIKMVRFEMVNFRKNFGARSYHVLRSSTPIQ